MTSKGALDERLPDAGRGHQGADAGAGVQVESARPGHTTHAHTATRPGADSAGPGQQPEGSGPPGLEQPPRSAETARNTDPGGPPRPTGERPPETERETRASTVGSSGRRSRRRPRNAERVRVVITGHVRRRRSRRRPLPGYDLTGDVEWFVRELQRKYPARLKRRAKATKQRVIDLVRVLLPPHPRRSGRPRTPKVSRALEMYRRQKREGRRTVGWLGIAGECIPGWASMSGHRRREQLTNLRNAVYKRLKRTKQTKTKPGSSR